MRTDQFSFVIPVYNRPNEIKELLDSMVRMNGEKDFEVVIVEDGSTLSSEKVIEAFKSELDISYFFKENSGPGDSRNFGMRKSRGDYFIILDSDCLLPQDYMNSVINALKVEYIDCFGGPDAAHTSFSPIQKAIDYSMTSFLTTGGIRGGKKSERFQPRSFNMGLSKKAFEATGGFGTIHPGEDPDLSIRLVNMGFKTRLIPEAYVYHKRRISWGKFYKQVNKFGQVRVILNRWHPGTARPTYWFPAIFVIALLGSIILAIIGWKVPVYMFGLYFLINLVSAWIKYGSLLVALLTPVSILIQFIGYGLGFSKAQLKLLGTTGDEREIFPHLFFDRI